VFIFIGLTPKTDMVRGIVDLDDGGYIVADRDMQTSAKGIFAGGDCIRKRLRQVVTACGDGATAAASAQHYVEELKGESY
jgi:thioredoxin reductase (NADPH)